MKAIAKYHTMADAVRAMKRAQRWLRRNLGSKPPAHIAEKIVMLGSL